MSKKRVALLGAGSWGTAQARHLAISGHRVNLWDIEQEVLAAINEKHRNPRHLQEIELPQSIIAKSEIEQAIAGAEVVVFALPSFAFREVARKVREELQGPVIALSTAKGLEPETQKRMSEVLLEELDPLASIAVLSGPSFALEVAKDLPTAVTVASRDQESAETVAKMYHCGNFRVYSSRDIIGVELGGVLKNVIAIAAGVVDALGYGHNARAALITRGLAEISRLVVRLGGEAATVAGLSGLGDLFLTATGDLSRNRQVGLRLGKGEKLSDIQKALGEVAEGVKSAELVVGLAERAGITVPISEEVSKLLSGSSTVHESATALLSRARASE